MAQSTPVANTPPALPPLLWELVEFTAADQPPLPVAQPASYTVQFLPEGKVGVRADCNRAMGSFTADPPRIDIKVAGVTRRLCPPGTLMDRYLADLEEVSSYVFRDGELFLALPMDAGIMAFTPRYIAPDPATPGAG